MSRLAASAPMTATFLQSVRSVFPAVHGGATGFDPGEQRQPRVGDQVIDVRLS
jgi:hypothetical protein